MTQTVTRDRFHVITHDREAIEIAQLTAEFAKEFQCLRFVPDSSIPRSKHHSGI